MVKSLQTALEGIIDYAGLFPPAALDLPQALNEFLAHLNGPESFLVNRFVCPCARLGALGDLIEGKPSGLQFGVSAIGSASVNLDGFAAAVELDWRQISAFNERFGETIVVDSFETKLQPGALGDQFRVLSRVRSLETYLEVPLGVEGDDTVAGLADTDFLAKGRTGGTVPGSHPSAEVLAAFLKECVDLDIPFKLTAGLHHPFPTVDERTGDIMHGFLNVIAALTAGEVYDLTRPEMAAILRAKPNEMEFSDEGIRALDWAVETDEVGQVRILFQGFGSCSAVEPVNELALAGLWP